MHARNAETRRKISGQCSPVVVILESDDLHRRREGGVVRVVCAHAGVEDHPGSRLLGVSENEGT